MPQLLNEYPAENRDSRAFAAPAANFSGCKYGYKLLIAAPGLQKEDFIITIEGNTLTISANCSEDIEECDEENCFIEYNYSSFSRSFSLPADVIKNNITAVYEDGLLKITLPREHDFTAGIPRSIILKKYIILK